MNDAQSAGDAAPLELRIDAKTFLSADGTPVEVISGLDLRLEAGSFGALIGPSGCGKTTTLRSIAGLETPSSGRILLHGEPVYCSATRRNVPTEKRRVSMVFQSYAIWPHMTVFENVAYGLRVRRLPRTYSMQPVPAILMLGGIFYGSQYDGAIGAILLNLPCHPPHAVTCLDGYPLTRQRRGGTALRIMMIASFFAASFGTVVMMFAVVLQT